MNDLISDIYEALENMREWRTIYIVLLKQCSGDRQQAMDALKFLIEMSKRLPVTS